MSYLQRFGTRRVPQWAPLAGQVPNSAGGHAWEADEWTRLRRFLILGSEGGSYYAGEWTLTRENAQAVQACVAAREKKEHMSPPSEPQMWIGQDAAKALPKWPLHTSVLAKGS